MKGKEEKKEPVCYNCQEPGHMAYNCPNPRKQRAFICYNCNQEGHMARNCPEERRMTTDNRDRTNREIPKGRGNGRQS